MAPSGHSGENTGVGNCGPGGVRNGVCGWQLQRRALGEGRKSQAGELFGARGSPHASAGRLPVGRTQRVPLPSCPTWRQAASTGGIRRWTAAGEGEAVTSTRRGGEIAEERGSEIRRGTRTSHFGPGNGDSGAPRERPRGESSRGVAIRTDSSKKTSSHGPNTGSRKEPCHTATVLVKCPRNGWTGRIRQIHFYPRSSGAPGEAWRSSEMSGAHPVAIAGALH